MGSVGGRVGPTADSGLAPRAVIVRPEKRRCASTAAAAAAVLLLRTSLRSTSGIGVRRATGVASDQTAATASLRDGMPRAGLCRVGVNRTPLFAADLGFAVCGVAAYHRPSKKASNGADG